jgi:hypothetical protein
MRICFFVLPLLFLTTLACKKDSVEPVSTSGSGQVNDSVELVSQSGSGQATVLLDGRRDDCVIDELVRGSGQIPVTNLQRPEGCHSEVAVFANDNESKLLGPSWTDGSDTVQVNMARPLSIPLAIWVMYPPQPSFSTLRNAVILDVDRATQLYDDEQCGVVFTADPTTDIHDVRHGIFSADLVEEDCTNPSSIAAFKNVGHANGKVNVYYINRANGKVGSACADGTSDVILIADLRSNEILAHELGHALSLGHPDELGNYQGVPAENAMMGTPSTPGSLTLGQCFRANFHTGSLLVRSGFRQSNRDCPHPTTSASTKTNDCPALNLEPSVP